MSGKALTDWRTLVTREWLERAQDSMPTKRRPDLRSLEMVGNYLAWSFVDQRGYVEETQTQIAKGLHNILSIDQIGDCTTAMQNVGIVVVVRTGAPGHGTRRVFSFHDPKNLAERDGASPTASPHAQDGANPPALVVEHNGVHERTQRGNDETERGYPLTPEQDLSIYLPARATICERVADAALDLDKKQGKGELRTPMKRGERRNTYLRQACTALEPFVDLDGLPVWALAEKLSGDAHGNAVDPRALDAWQRWCDDQTPAQPVSTITTVPACDLCNDTGEWFYDFPNSRPCPKCKGQP